MLGVLPNHGFFQITYPSHNRWKCKKQFQDPKLQSDQANIPHMERGMGEWHPTKPDKHPKLAVEVALHQDAYNKICLKRPTTTG